ncbi:hypothetical protein ACC771_01575, partial [Rhizobium ruizarguesonis]
LSPDGKTLFVELRGIGQNYEYDVEQLIAAAEGSTAAQLAFTPLDVLAAQGLTNSLRIDGNFSTSNSPQFASIGPVKQSSVRGNNFRTAVHPKIIVTDPVMLGDVSEIDLSVMIPKLGGRAPSSYQLVADDSNFGTINNSKLLQKHLPAQFCYLELRYSLHPSPENLSISISA